MQRTLLATLAATIAAASTGGAINVEVCIVNNNPKSNPNPKVAIIPAPKQGEEYIKTLLPHILEAQKLARAENLRIPFTSVTIAQAILESEYGKSKLARQGNNHFGLKRPHKDKQSPVIMMKDDDRDKRGKLVPSPFLIFPDATAATLRHYKRLNRPDMPGYAKGLEQTTPEAQIKQIAKTYATNKKYAEAIIALIETYNLKQYDNTTQFNN